MYIEGLLGAQHFKKHFIYILSFSPPSGMDTLITPTLLKVRKTK